MAGSVEGVMRRKLAAGRAEGAAGGPGADRGWRLSLARAARDRLRTDLDVRSQTLDRRTLGEVIELAPERAMIAVLDGPEEGLGVLMLAPAILAGMIEAQTIGRVKSSEIVPRRTTRTDAAMVAGVIDAALRSLEQALADEADLVWAGGFRYASFLEEPRPLGLLLEDTTYRVLKAEVDLGNGARLGEVILALPAEGRGQRPSIKPGLETGNDHGHQFIQALSERVNGAASGLEAVLARLRLPLADVTALEVGMVLALPDAALDAVSLVGLDGRAVAEGRLGQNRGMRAIRLKETGSDAREQSPALSALSEMNVSEMPLADMSMADMGFGTMPLPEAGEGEEAAPMEFGDFPAMEGIDLDFAATGTD